MLTRRTLLSGALGAAAAASAARLAAAGQDPRPSILFIMADDLGYADLSCYGRRDYRTPNLDRLAAEGVRFTQAYANSPVCSATRTALMTGRYQHRLPVGLEEPLSVRDVGLPPDHPTLPSLLRGAGYATALIGKWHLGRLPDFGPLQSGYDRFWGFRNGAVDYFTHSVGDAHDLWDGDTPVHRTGYLTDLLADQAIATLREYGPNGRPFFLSLHFSAPHWPWEGPDDQHESERISAGPGIRALMHYDGGTMATYAEMVTRLDFQVGRVLEALRSQGFDRDTIVVFTSDNGGERFSDTWPFSGRKTELLEGGIRVPAILRWPRRIAASRSSDAQIMTMDWLPTLLAAAGASADRDIPADGIDIAPALDGGSLPERILFWRYRNHAQQACRRGDWKYLSMAGNAFLFDLADDPMERANLRAREPARFRELVEAWNAWNANMLPFDSASNSHGFTGDNIADRFGVPAREPAPPRPAER